jgi:inorganic pyrophosphatase
MKQKMYKWAAALSLTCALASGCRTLPTGKDLYRGVQPLDAQGYVRVVVEIPTGTNAKWEVDKETGRLAWEVKDGRPRVVQYLGYPGNYGMIPRTLLSEEHGGDGDPLDVIVLAPAVPRGSVLKARLVGVLKLLDDGEQDDKLIAVVSGSPLGDVRSITELDRLYPGITGILETWFANYKGPGRIQPKGFADADEAGAVLRRAIAAYARRDHAGDR